MKLLTEPSIIYSPFVQTYVVSGKVFSRDAFVENIRAEIRFTRPGEEPVSGAFYGDAASGRGLIHILVHGDLEFQGVLSVPRASYSIEFRMKNILFESFTTRSETDKLCDFTCGELNMVTTYSAPYLDDPKPHKIVFNYSIPKRQELRVLRLPPFLKAEMPDYKEYLEFQTMLGNLKIVTTDYHEPATLGSKDVTILANETDLILERALDLDENLVNVSPDVDTMVSDYLLVISLLLKHRTMYHRKTVVVENAKGKPISKDVTVYRRSETKPGFRGTILSWYEYSGLIENIVPQFNNHDDKAIIEEAITFFLAGIDERFSETKLIVFQSGIEVIVNSLYNKFGMASKSCPECNQRTDRLRDRLVEVMSRLHIGAADIYPTVMSDPSQTFPFIRYRNSILHGRRNEVNSHDLIKELYREEMLLQHLLYRWIGMDPRRVPHLYPRGERVTPY